MGIKKAPEPTIPEAQAPPPIINRADLDAKTKTDIQKSVVARTSTVEGESSPQVSLLKEKEFWEKKKKSLLNK
jgi:hypothetical protein